MTNYNNEMKLHTLNQLASALRVVDHNINVLEMLDNDSSEDRDHDIHNQITTMHVHKKGIEGALKRARHVVSDE